MTVCMKRRNKEEEQRSLLKALHPLPLPFIRALCLSPWLTKEGCEQYCLSLFVLLAFCSSSCFLFLFFSFFFVFIPLRPTHSIPFLRRISCDKAKHKEERARLFFLVHTQPSSSQCMTSGCLISKVIFHQSAPISHLPFFLTSDRTLFFPFPFPSPFLSF